MNPRSYFLRSVQHRLDVVVQSHEYLVEKLKEGFEVWVKEHDARGIRPGHQAIRHQQLEDSLHCIGEMTKVFRNLRQRFSRARDGWERFSGPRGDILYFEDLRNGNARDALHKIEESFEKMSDLERELHVMLDTCSEETKAFSLHLEVGKHGMKRAMTIKTEEAATSAANSEKFAGEMARATRVNMQLLIITTAVVIALQYFCSDQALFSFERNSRTFWISLCVLVPGLSVLFFVLNALDHVKFIFFDRFYGRLGNAVTPTIEPV
ncbi:hypothetical protein N0V87_006736 [Didymella glomerata]|uniref:Uncharacterized protein n=1 Tax=Didymella glomerata TaxID=749621 RepID=A0A9W8WWX3_9PLEO|nr:hypothetical protein N0V87_006736 [Didymella glomerata]